MNDDAEILYVGVTEGGEIRVRTKSGKITYLSMWDGLMFVFRKLFDKNAVLVLDE